MGMGLSVWLQVLLSIASSLVPSWPPLSISAPNTVTHLPWFHGPLPFSLETGYVEVDEVNEVQMFYYFVESERSPEKDPLVVWLTGGPGCSAFCALSLELGPLMFDVAAYNEGRPCLVYNPYTWTKVSNIIFVDAPIGAGFSYSKAPEGYMMSDTKSTLQLYIFIKKWLIDHPKFLTNPLYIGGDSYGGKIVPLLAQEIANRNQVGTTLLLNLKGYIAGNPRVDSLSDTAARVPYAHGMGLIPNELYESAKQSCDGNYASPKDENCTNALNSIDACTNDLNFANILEPKCFEVSLESHRVGTDKSSLPLNCIASNYYLAEHWTNIDAVREAINIHKGSVKDWKRCIPDAESVYNFDVPSTFKVHQNLTSRGYRALVYSGDHDLLVPHVGTEAWIRALNFSLIEKWRPWFKDQHVAGYTQSYSNNMTFATVKGGGHVPASDHPKESLAMFGRWISNVPL